MEERKFRVGIAGAGFIGAVHARSARLAGATLAGVADSSPESAEAAARRLGADRAFESALALAGETRSVGTEDAAVMQFETDGGAVGTTVISQISAGRKNRLLLEVDTAEESLVFDQEEPETLWCGRRDAVSLLKRDPAVLSAPAARLSWLPAGHAQGWGDCFAAFIADTYAAIRQGEPVDGLPDFADGLRAARITGAVLESATTDQWVDVPAREPMEVSP
jgi:predicted dehydrogenase